MGTTIGWGDAVMGVDEDCVSGLHGLLANDACAIDDDNIGLEIGYQCTAFIAVDAFDIMDGLGGGPDHFQVLGARYFADSLAITAQKKWP